MQRGRIRKAENMEEKEEKTDKQKNIIHENVKKSSIKVERSTHVTRRKSH